MRVEKENKNTYHFHEDKRVGTGYIFEFLASKLYNEDRMNYFIDFDFYDQPRKDMVEYLIEEVKSIKEENYPHMNARVYHCCFSHAKDKIDFYKSIDGFQADESMVILRKDIKKATVDSILYDVIEDNLNDHMESFLESHGQIFVSAPYDEEKLDRLLKQGMKSLGIYDKDICIANILLIEDNNQAWVEDMFVKESYRKQGLASYLLKFADSYFLDKGYKEVFLEVWYANDRAVKCYKKHGYTYDRTTEVSIGKSI